MRALARGDGQRVVDKMGAQGDVEDESLHACCEREKVDRGGKRLIWDKAGYE